MTAEKEKSLSHSLLRILNATALTLIALSVFAQSISVVIALSGGAENTVAGLNIILGIIGFTIAPGILLAFAKFLLNAIRSFKDKHARIKALGYLAITSLPFMLPLLIATQSVGAMPDAVLSEAPQSDQFLAGRDWAREKLPTRGSDCTGSGEFNRGCRSAISERRDKQYLAGRDWARENPLAKAAECQGPPYFTAGCRAYFFEHLAKPKPAGQGRYEGMTTAECRAEVNAKYEAAKQVDLEDGNQRSIDVTYQKRWLPELRECANYDILAAPKVAQRLQLLLDKLKAGHVVTAEEKTGVLKDFAEMSRYEDQPYKTAYFDMFEEFFDRMNGTYKEPVTIYPRISCEAYQIKIDEMIRLDKERVAAMQALKRADGVVTDSDRHNYLNEQRIEMLWDWKLYTDGAKAAACEIKKN